MKRCQTCAEKIPNAATVCPRCHQRQSLMAPSVAGPGKPATGSNPVSGGRGSWIGVAAGLAVVAIVAAGSALVWVGYRIAPTPPNTPPTAAPIDIAAETGPQPPPVQYTAQVPPSPPEAGASGPPLVVPPPGLTPNMPPAAPGTCTAKQRAARFAATVEQRLGGLATFEIVSTTNGPVDGDVMTMIMSYRASRPAEAPRNGVAIGKVNVVNCGVTLNVVT